jgi:hypothetical protein
METAMKTSIKLALLAAVGAALLALPASAESRQFRRQVQTVLQYQPAQGTFLNDTVTLGNEYVGRDADMSDRGELIKNDVY